MQLQGKYTVPDFIGVPAGTYPEAVAIIKENTLELSDRGATVVFCVFSDDSKEVKLLDFVTSVEFSIQLVLVDSKPSEYDVLNAIELLARQAINDMCHYMSVV